MQGEFLRVGGRDIADCVKGISAFATFTESFGRLTIRTNAEKLQFVGHGLETVFGGDAFLQFAWKTLDDLDDFRAAGANEVMMVSIIGLANEFKSSCAVPEIELFHHAHLLQQVHCPIDRGQVAFAFGHGGQDFPGSHGVRMFSQNFQNGQARTGDFTRLTPQPIGQRGQRLWFV